MNQQKSSTYHYQKVTTTSRTVREPNQNKYSSQNRTVTTTNSRTVNKPKITVNELKTNSTQIPRCNKCGKLKCAANQKQIINEQGSWSRKTESLNNKIREEIYEINRHHRNISKKINKTFNTSS